MKAKDFRIDQDYSFDHFMELTKTGITYNAKNLDQFAEDYHQAKLHLLTDKALNIQNASNCYDEDDLRHVFECFDQHDSFDKQLKEFNAPI